MNSTSISGATVTPANASVTTRAPVENNQYKGCGADLWDRVWLPIIIAVSSFIFFRFFQFAVRWYLFGKWSFPTFSYFAIPLRRRRRRKQGSSRSNRSNRSNMNSTSLQLVPPNKKWRISNELISLAHSVISGFWALAVLTHFDDYIQDLVHSDTKEGRYLIYMSFGYLVHDFTDLVINERSTRIIELLFHHVVVICAFLITQITCKFLYIVVMGLLMEVNSVFLHSRSLCNLYRQPKDSNMFKIIAVLNLATFMLFRIAISFILISWQIGQYINSEEKWYLQLINSLVIYSLSVTNFILCYRVLAADGLLGKSRARRDPTASRNQQKQQSEDEDEEDEEGEDEDEGVESDESPAVAVMMNGSALSEPKRLAEQKQSPKVVVVMKDGQNQQMKEEK